MTNQRLLDELLICKSQKELTFKLAEMLYVMCKKIANKPHHIHIPYKDSMIEYAWRSTCLNFINFDESKTVNAYTYFGTMITMCYNQYITTKECLKSMAYEQVAAMVIDLPINIDIRK